MLNVATKTGVEAGTYGKSLYMLMEITYYGNSENSKQTDPSAYPRHEVGSKRSGHKMKPRSKNSGFRSASPFGGVGPTYICSICKKRTRETGHDESSCELCKSCYLKELMTNEHSDHGHDQPVDGCPSCKHEAEWEAENDMSWAEHKKIEQQKLEEKRN